MYKADHPGRDFTCAAFRADPAPREFQVNYEGTSNPRGVATEGHGSLFVSAWKIDSHLKHKHQKAAYCVIHWIDSDAYPEHYRGKLFMRNIYGSCINVDSLQRDGSTYAGSGEPDFLSANDAWFMPVGQETGPDGSLYILDWYDRYHCYQDANRDADGIDRLKGRLYRVRYKDTPRAAGFDLTKESDEQLIERLNAGNDFIRSTAQRLLHERVLPTVFPTNNLIKRGD